MDIDAFIESLMKTEKPQKYPHSMYYTEGTKYLNLRLYNKALEFLNEAVDIDKTSIKSRLKRSRCLIALREFKKAIEDSELVLRLSPGCVEAMDLKGEAQYLTGDFEGGYLTYLNGRRKNPIRNELRLGKQLCAEAMYNSFDSVQKERITKKDAVKAAKMRKDDEVFERKLKNRRINRDCFRLDKKYLEQLMKSRNVASVHEYCQEAMDYIKNRERFWAMVTPLYSRKKIQKIVEREPRRPDMVQKQISIYEAALRRAEIEVFKGRIGNCLSEVDNVLSAVETLPTEKENEKLKLKCDAFHVLGQAYKSEGNNVLSIQYLLKELEIADELGLKISRIRAYHVLGEHFQLQGNIQKAFQCFNEIKLMQPGSTIELLKKDAHSNEIAQLRSAQDWLDSVVSSVRLCLRDTIYLPVLHTMEELFSTMV